MATVTTASGVKRTVKNLGWLFKHYGEIAHFEVRSLGPELGGFDLRAVMADGSTYQTEYQSFTVACELFWFRSIFDGLEVRFYGCSPTCFNRRPSRNLPTWQRYIPMSDDLTQCYQIAYCANQYQNRRGEWLSDYTFSYLGPERVTALKDAQLDDLSQSFEGRIYSDGS